MPWTCLVKVVGVEGNDIVGNDSGGEGGEDGESAEEDFLSQHGDGRM